VAATPDSREPASTPLAPGEKPPLRDISGAPEHLKKAAMIVTVGAILPFMNHGGVGMVLAGKALVLLGAFLWFKQVEHNWGPKLSGALGNLAELRFGKKPTPEDAEKAAKRAARKQEPAMAMDHPFPTGLHVAALLLILGGCIALPLLGAGFDKGKAIAEIGMLAWAAGTIVHIHSYERWGKFNPIFPLMFAGMAFAGIIAAIGGVTGEIAGLAKLAAIVGGAAVGLGGGMAAFTIVEAMLQAKKEGDTKQQAQLEERRKAREARRKKGA